MNPESLLHLKRLAGEAAVSFVESGMIIGLGHGSTAIWALRLIAEKIRQGELKNIRAVPCSSKVAEDALQAGIAVTDFEDIPAIDLTIDGADEVDAELNLIKGAGGALLREKIVAQASRREIIVVDRSKVVSQLGESKRLPVEIVPFGLASQLRYLESIGAEVLLRRNSTGGLFRTDQRNFIADCAFGPLTAPARLASALQNRAGLVGHGLFLDLATDLVVADENGINHLTADRAREMKL